MSLYTNKKFLTEFIETYRNLPELWQTKSEAYKNRSLKEAAYANLLDKYREFDEYATIEIMKKRINCLRTCYRRELKKATNSMKYRKEPYTPTLWYFDLLDFLRDQEFQFGISSEQPTENPLLMEEESSQRQKKRRIRHDFKSKLLNKAARIINEYNQEDDEDSSYSLTWEHLFRKLKAEQKLYANKLIMDVLFRGAMGKLSKNSKITQQRRKLYVPVPSSSSEESDHPMSLSRAEGYNHPRYTYSNVENDDSASYILDDDI